MNDTPHHTRLPPALYVVATPIGNLGDITLRALETLKQADRVAAEDTRVSGQLLAHFGIHKSLASIREHNEREAADKVIAWIMAGEAVAYVSDAGTPAISDPGARLVAAVRAAGLAVVPIPGASAVVAALSAAGLAPGPWLFHGFLSPKAGAREAEIKSLASLPVALVFYEAPHRIVETVAALAALLGDRELTLARELTKKFETLHTLPLVDAVAWLTADANRVRGEFVVVVHPPAAAEAAGDPEALRVLDILAAELPPTLAAKLAAKITGRTKAELYQMTLKNL
ncbi:MAG: 16S rRNA (cytidine(1402)-2'-O)-methyltransferase [Hydrogenophilales bacterium 16-64-46]|nr:MAG: 16S rRNA (cytidine(1402)-2'-O)-methyltransferase [Hydrogenophilales bacterium 12-64-13]OYZ06673.1 MAG: 16S rRNA (cytidine(1402)-2'-O)-methyltransferase [Hydrogenophilales bacterium 16-64-46]OZA39381.1 MAG: 16S rRNA (cytidine(1402)-2'-O)-methyltransferase [Hydrogenophilales bacterium 17-64-34]HQT01427.1 16S rRNA (cytidine(1402)-2'-O)-methyltransferase [Thiobacillus sp.]